VVAICAWLQGGLLTSKVSRIAIPLQDPNDQSLRHLFIFKVQPTFCGCCAPMPQPETAAFDGGDAEGSGSQPVHFVRNPNKDC